MTTQLTLTIREAAAESGFSTRVITAAIVRGDLRAKLPPGNVTGLRIIRADLVKWLNDLPDAAL